MLPESDEATLIGFVVLTAKLNAVYYSELIKQGFTKEQALDLVQTNGLNLTEIFAAQMDI